MTTCTVHTDQPTADGIHLCHACMLRLEQDLAEIGSVWDDLQITMAKLDRGSPRLSSPRPQAAAPVNLGALDAAAELTRVLAAWGSCLPARMPTGDAPRHASHLLGQLGDLRRMEWAGDFAAELHRALSWCRAVTDRAAERVTLGPCGAISDGVECQGTMVAQIGGREARCRVCGATLDARERIRWLVSEAWHVLLPLPEVIRALESVGVQVKLKTARHWASVGKLEGTIGADGTVLYSPAAVKAVADRSRPRNKAPVKKSDTAA